MSDLATIVIVSTISPAVLAALTWWLRRADKHEDWRRQDEVAARVAEVQEALAAQEEKTSAKLDTLQQTSDATKTLVDGQMTASIEAELASTERELQLLRQVATLHLASGQEVTGEAKNTIELTQVKIDELRATLADRHRKDFVARAQLEHDKPDPEPTIQPGG